jgi:hypothetical protein
MSAVLKDSRSEKLLRGIAYITALSLFPAFFFYHTAIAFNIIPPVLAGFFGPMAIVCGLPLLITQFWVILEKRARIILIDQLFIATILYMIVWATINYMFGTGLQRDQPFYVYSIFAIYYWLVIHVTFRNIRLDKGWFVWMLAISLLGMFVIALLNAKGQFFYAAQDATSDDVAVATYQGFARSALVVAVLLLSSTKGIRATIVIVTTLVLLFVLGARSEFVGFAVTSMVILSVREGWAKMLLFWVPLLVLCVGFITVSENVLSGNSRILQLLNVTQASSYIGREGFEEHAITTIGDHLLFGDYASQLAFGGIGSYAHNALSAWVSYGLMGFILFASMLIYAPIKIGHLFLKHRGLKNNALIAALGFSIYSIILAFAAKPVYDPIYAVAWGMLASALHCIARKRDENSSRDDSAWTA